MRGSDRRKRPIEFSTPPCFLPRAVRIAEERLDAERHLELVVFGELVSIVEADSLTQTLWQFAELMSDGPGRNSFSIGRTANHAEAALSFVKNHQPLTTSENIMKSASQWPGALRSSTSAGRSVIERRCFIRLAVLPPRRRRPRIFL